jgi:acyl-CoA thioesterase-1
MIRIFLLITIVPAALFLGWFFFKNEEVPAAQVVIPSGPIVVFGDSITTGYGVAEGKDYVSPLEAQIGEPIIRYAKNGETTETALTSLEEVVAEKPKLVVVFLGGNDVLRRIPSSETFANLEKIVSSIKSTGAQVILVGVPGGILGDPYAKLFEELAERYDAEYVPEFLSRLLRNREYMHDSIHPNEKGHLEIAEKLRKPLEAQLDQLQ